jgi:hypothetical protein
MPSPANLPFVPNTRAPTTDHKPSYQAISGASKLGATIAGTIAVVALATWIIIYAQISAPINTRLTAAAERREVPSDTRLLQQQWDSVITARSGLQMLAILALCTALIIS